MKCLIWLYPRAWRRRYGVELAALVEDAGTGWGDLLNVAGAGLRMRVASLWPLVAGALVGVGVTFWMTPFRVSSWAIGAVGHELKQDQLERISLRNTELAKVIEKHALMVTERQWLPQPFVVCLFRQAITIKARDGFLETTYVGPEPNTRVALDLIGALNRDLFPRDGRGIVFSVKNGDGDGEPTRPYPVALPLFGAILGLAAGALGRQLGRLGSKDRGRL